ncbi:MAG: DUF6599 family protein [Pyrinomonadaceae bacterium]
MLIAFTALSLPVGAVLETDKALPESFGSLQAQGPVSPGELAQDLQLLISDPTQFRVTGMATRIYASPEESTNRVKVTLIQTETDSSAYALFTSFRKSLNNSSEQPKTPIIIGIAGAADRDRVAFFKGKSFVVVESADSLQVNPEMLAATGRAFAEQLDAIDDEIPVLVKHLPNWETAQESAVYAVSLQALQRELGSYGELLDGFDFGGGTEAVIAPHRDAEVRLVIIEQTTPQLAAANDAFLSERVLKFRQEGKPAPTAFQRKGNYLVFVVGEPDEEIANELIGKVRYEQLVRWLGDNPRAFDLANRRYAETTANVIITTLKATGVSLLLCLGIGGIFGGIVFLKRRSRQVGQEAYSDAGGMIRLNLEELNSPSSNDSRNLTGGGR